MSTNFYIFQIEVYNYLIALKSADYTYNTYILYIHKKAADPFCNIQCNHNEEFKQSSPRNFDEDIDGVKLP